MNATQQTNKVTCPHENMSMIVNLATRSDRPQFISDGINEDPVAAQLKHADGSGQLNDLDRGHLNDTALTIDHKGVTRLRRGKNEC